MRHETPLLAMLAALAIATSCAPDVAAVPCNEDEDCAGAEHCARGVCSEGAALAPRPGEGIHDDGGDAPTDLDGGRPSPDAADAGSDAGPVDDDAGPFPPGDGGPRDGGGEPDVDGGEPADGGPEPVLDGGPEPVLDAGPAGIVSFTASPDAVALGESVTLAWDTRGVTSCVLEGSRESLGATGTLVVERPAGRPYVLRCTGEEGETYEAEVLVEVTCPAEQTLPSLTIASDADLLAAAEGFTGVTCVDVTGDVVVENVTATDLTALYGLRSVGGNLAIGGDLQLTSLDGLELLRSVGGDLRLGYQEVDTDPLMVLPSLVSVHGLSALESVGVDLDVLGAAKLTSLAGLERLVSVGDDLEVHDNPLLASLDGLARLATIGTDIEMSEDPALSRLGLPALSTVGGGVFLADVGVGGLQGLARLTGELRFLRIVDCDSLVDLTGLEGITDVRGELTLQFNDGLVSLAGLSNVTHAERVVVRRNVGLISADLPALQRVDYEGAQLCSGDACDGDLTFESNVGLVAIEGFGALTYVRRNLNVTGNPMLVRVGGFGALTNVNNDLVIRDNAGLMSVEGFAALAEADDVFIEGNDALTTLRLPSLATVDDDVRVLSNAALPTLSGLGSLARAGGDFEINANPQLTTLGLSALTSVGDYATCDRGCLLAICGNASLPADAVTALLDAVGRPVDDTDTTVLTEGNGRCP